MKRVWKPLDVKGLRLYEVRCIFLGHPQYNKHYSVFAQSPSHAARLISRIYSKTEWMAGINPPVIEGYAINVYQPASWWTEEDDED